MSTEGKGNPVWMANMSHWLDEIVGEYEQTALPNPHQGKPIFIEDVHHPDYHLNKLLKNAHVLPAWIELQHQIRDQIGDLLSRLEKLPPGEAEREVERLNLLVKKYNLSCPAAAQKAPLYLDILEKQYQHWL